jgi:hypothetical protein
MKIFKFTSGGSPFPDIYYFSETISFTDIFDYDIFYKALLSENLLLHSIGGSIYNYLLEEVLTLRGSVGYPEYLNEILELSDLMEQWGWGDFFEGLQLSDSCIPRMVYSISLNENLALVESGTYNLAKVDYKVTWRSRSRQPLVGYGKAGYGIETGYGEGDCTDLKAFKIRVYTMPAHTLKRTATITIVDTQNPDDDAEYIYTSAFNLADNTTFKSNLRFEVTQVDQDDIESPVASIDIEPIPV